MTGGVMQDAPLTDAEARIGAVADGLFAALAARPPEEHEHGAESVFALLKDTRAATMLIPRSCGGMGVTAAAAVRFQTALGSLAPSAAIATTMHHYKIAALGRVAAAGDEHAQVILRDIAAGSKLVASGGAESAPGRDLRNLGSWAVREPDGEGYRVTGLKRPCSLSASMDMMSVMVELRTADGFPEGYAQAFVPAAARGLEREAFWRSPVFRAAESHAVRLSDVRVPRDHVFPLRGETGRRFAADCYMWFQLLISASYLGIACCLAQATAPDRRAGSRRWTGAVRRINRLEDRLLDAARAVDDHAPAGRQLNLAVEARDHVEDEAGAIGGELLRAAGGAAFARSDFHTVLAGALNAIAFHPPQRGAREGVGLESLTAESRERG